MKSKIETMASLEELLQKDDWKPDVDEHELAEKEKQYCLKFKTYTQVDTVCDGDVVTVELQSEKEFFHRTVDIAVGKGFFDRDLEAALIGMKLRQTSEVSHGDAEKIIARIEDIRRLSVPELTDELLKRNDDQFHTVDEFRRSVLREMSADQIRERSFFYMDELIRQSNIYIDEAEVESLTEQEIDRCREIAKGMGKVFDEMTSDELLGAVGEPDLDSFRHMVRDMSRTNICQALFQLNWENRDSLSFPVIEKDILDEACEASNYVVNKIMRKLQLA